MAGAVGMSHCCARAGLMIYEFARVLTEERSDDHARLD